MAKTKFHSQYNPERIASLALVVGDPERAAETSKMMESVEEIWNNREYRAFTGVYKGKRITVCSHGVGGGGASYIFENLFNGGVKTIIRAGTCGALKPGTRAGALMIGTAAIRMDGVSQFIAAMEYPAVADHKVTIALEEAAVESAYAEVYSGIVLTDGLFFKYPHSGKQPVNWADAGAIAIEMEYAPLLVQAGVHGVKAGGIFTADGSPEEEKDAWDYNPNQQIVTDAKEVMLKVALDALAKLG
jgi:uridine phosphorylase